MVPIRIRPDMERLLLALLLSWLLHVALLFPSLFAAKPSTQQTLTGQDDGTLLARLVNLNPTVVATAAKFSNKAPATAPASQPAQEQSASPALEQFFPVEQLDKRPRSQGEVDLDIAEAVMIKKPGSLMMKIWIDSLGRVVAADIESSSLPVRFTHALAQAFGRVHFEPGELYGRPVGSILRIEISHQGDTNAYE